MRARVCVLSLTTDHLSRLISHSAPGPGALQLTPAHTSFLLFKRRVERRSARGKIIGLHISARLRCSMDSVHSGVLPFDRERATVSDVVQRDNDLFETDVAVANRTEIPVPAIIAKIGVAAKNANVAIAMAPPGIFHMSVIDPVSELAEKFHVAHALISKVGRIVVEPESLVVLDGLQGTVR